MPTETTARACATRPRTSGAVTRRRRPAWRSRTAHTVVESRSTSTSWVGSTARLALGRARTSTGASPSTRAADATGDQPRRTPAASTAPTPPRQAVAARSARSVGEPSAVPRARTTTARAQASTPCTARRCGDGPSGTVSPAATASAGAAARRSAGAPGRSRGTPSVTTTAPPRSAAAATQRAVSEESSPVVVPAGVARRPSAAATTHSSPSPTPSAGTTRSGTRRVPRPDRPAVAPRGVDRSAARLTVASGSSSSRRRVESSTRAAPPSGSRVLRRPPPARAGAGERAPGADEDRSRLTTSRCRRCVVVRTTVSTDPAGRSSPSRSWGP